MIFKIFFIGVIILSSVGIGNVLVRDKSERLRMLGMLGNCVKALRSAMLHQGMPFSAALRQAEKVGFFGFFEDCRRVLERNPELAGRDICQKALRIKRPAFDYLRQPELMALGDLMGRVSTAIVPEQIGDAVAIFNRQISMITSELAKTNAKNAKVVKTMCLLGGLVVAIILI